MNANRPLNVIRCLAVCVLSIVLLPLCAASQEVETTIEHEAGFYYTIEKGDTLWDLSDQFFDLPWLWPELWRENRQIPNPHRIYPGERIRLYQQEGRDALRLTPPEAKTGEAENAAAAATAPAVEAAPEPVYYLYPAIDAVGFITKDPPAPLGTIFNVEGGQQLVDQGTVVYLRYPPGDTHQLLQGGRYTIYRRLQPTTDRRRNKQLGTQYYVVGILEITALKTEFAVAQILRSFRAVNLDDFILPYRQRSPKIPIVPSVQGLEGEIVVSEEHREIMGDFTVAFIDKGTRDQVQPGQFYSIFKQSQEPIIPKTKNRVALPPVDYGHLIVLHAEQETATVLITQSDHHIEPGARIRTPINE